MRSVIVLQNHFKIALRNIEKPTAWHDTKKPRVSPRLGEDALPVRHRGGKRFTLTMIGTPTVQLASSSPGLEGEHCSRIIVRSLHAPFILSLSHVKG